MSSQHESGIGKSDFPTLSGSDSGRIREEAMPLLLLSQPSKLVVERMFSQIKVSLR